MNEYIINVATMQDDHRTWLAAHAQWRQDIERWQIEHESAIARLAELQKVISEHGAALAEHARAFQQAETAIATHDREIVQQQKGAGTQPQDVVANRHQEQEGNFDRHKDAHERIRKHHEVVMAQIETLQTAVRAAM